MPTDYNAAAAAAAARAAEARRRAEEARRRAEEAAKRAAEAAAKKAAETAKKAAEAAKKLKAREKPSTRFEALKKEPVRRESKSTRFEALSKKPVRRESKSTRFEAQKPEATKAARERFQELSDEAGSKKVLEELGVQNARDFQKLGNDYAASLKGKGECINVGAVQDKKTLTRVLQASAETQTGEAAEKLKDPVVATMVAHGIDGRSAANAGPALEQAGLKPQDVAKIAERAGSNELQKLSRAINVLTDEKASKEDKAVAVMDLGGKAGRLLPEGTRESLVEAAFEHMEHPHKIVGALDRLQDPNASAQEKMDASVDLALGMKAGIGKVLPQVSAQLARGDSPARIAAAAFTLVDDKSSTSDRAIAAAQLGMGISDFKYDVQKMTALFKKARLPDAAEIAKKGDVLADLGSRGLDLDAVKKLPEARLQQLTELSAKLNPEALKSIGPMLEGLDANAQGRFLAVADGMRPETLDDVLGSSDEAQRFTDTLAKLDVDKVDDFAEAAAKMDGAALKLVTKLGATAPSSVVNDFLPALSKVAGSEAVNKAMALLDKALRVMKVDLDAGIASKALKGLGKLLPGISVGVSSVSAFKYGKEAVELQGKQDDLAFLAHTGMKLNALDAALEFIPGIGTLAGMGTGVAALALDLGFQSEKAKFQKDPTGYEAPDWVKAANVGMAMIGPPPGAGIPELVATYGVKDAAELGLWAVGKGGKLAEGAWELIKKIGGPAAEIAMQAVDRLKDLGEAGVEALEYIAKAPGELGAAVAEAAVDRLEELGELGVEALKSIASSGADVAKKAAEGLKNLADAGLDVAKDALGTLKDVPGAVGDFVSGLGDLLPDINLPGPL